MRKIRFFIGISLFVQSLMTLTVILVLSIQKKSLPKAVFAVLALGSAASAWCLISERNEQRRNRLFESDSFYDDGYNFDFDADEDDEEYFDLGFEDGDELIPDRELRF